MPRVGEIRKGVPVVTEELVNGDEEELGYDITTACQISGANSDTVRLWIRQGVLPLLHLGGKGRGNSHKLSFMAILGLTVGTTLRETGAPPDIALGIAHYLSHLTRDALDEHIRARRVIPHASWYITIDGARYWSNGTMSEPEEVRDYPVRKLWHNCHLPMIYEDVRDRLGA